MVEPDPFFSLDRRDPSRVIERERRVFARKVLDRQHDLFRAVRRLLRPLRNAQRAYRRFAKITIRVDPVKGRVRILRATNENARFPRQRRNLLRRRSVEDRRAACRRVFRQAKILKIRRPLMIAE